MRSVLRPMGLPADTEVALAFVDDPRMRELNARHRGKDRVTDILSFGEAWPASKRGPAVAGLLRREPDGSLALGDVVVASEQARRQARRRGWTVAEEVAFLASHGALHLVGYDDATAAGYREMRALGLDAVRSARRAVRRS